MSRPNLEEHHKWLREEERIISALRDRLIDREFSDNPPPAAVPKTTPPTAEKRGATR